MVPAFILTVISDALAALASASYRVPNTNPGLLAGSWPGVAAATCARFACRLYGGRFADDRK